ncbi:MAG: acyl dehydratase [Pseudomonas sp.]|nr:acyl dehydratase [Pseudomonas sp.]
MSTACQHLATPPALPGLFLRAALRRGMRSQPWPNLGLRCALSVEPKHLVRYRQVCGIAASAYLPAAYPHILAFPLQMQLLTDARFPLPLLGLVHVQNRVRVLRPLGGLGPFTVSVEVGALQPHSKGGVFSLITRLEDQLGLLWEGESRMLCRGLSVPGVAVNPAAPTPLPLSEVAQWAAAADIGRRYARVAGDFNPIHLCAATAKLFGFPRAIAHGFWNKARTLAELQQHLPNAGYELSVRFQQPLLLPGAVTLQASAPGPNGQLSLQGQDGAVHMSGHWQPL